MGSEEPGEAEAASSSVSISVPTSDIDRHEKILNKFRKGRDALRKQMNASSAKMKAEKRKRQQLAKKLSGIKTHDLVVMCAMRGVAQASEEAAKPTAKANAKRSAKEAGAAASAAK